MQIITLSLKGPKLIIPRCYCDERGFFLETYHQERYSACGITETFVQDNHSFSKQGVIRGLHFQQGSGQAKLVRVLQGKIWDVVVDIRPDSPTFGKWEGVELCDKAQQQLYVPVGFAHGFCALSQEAHVAYKVSTYYKSEEEKAIFYADPDLAISWPIKNPCVSERDEKALRWKEICLLL